MNSNLKLNPNPLVQFLGKPAAEFTKNDLLKYVEENGIEMLNLRYVGGDGRLKCLNFVINSIEHLDAVLSSGERVDGSSLFSHIETGSSDLYVVPRYRSAFLNPFTEIPTLDILCSYFNKDGEPLESSPEYIMRKAHQELKDKTLIVAEHREVSGAIGAALLANAELPFSSIIAALRYVEYVYVKLRASVTISNVNVFFIHVAKR